VQAPALLVTVPLLGALLISITGRLNRKVCFPLAAVSLGVSLYLSILLLFAVLTEGEVFYKMGGWPPPWGISYHIDHLNALVLVVVSLVSFVNLPATYRYVHRDFADRTGPFYALYVLMVAGLLGIVVTGDAFNLYVLLEIAALTGYALIAMGEAEAPLASLNYVLMGTIGASFYLLGVGYLYIVTGSLNMWDIASLLPNLYQSKAVFAAFAIMMIGIWIKMAFFPLHAWLPRAYVYAPSPVSSLVAPLVTKVMVYVMIRMLLSVFTPDFAFSTLELSRAVVWLAVVAIVGAALLALAQQNLKKMLAYVIVSEVAYMVGGAWLGNRAGLTGSILHISNDALMTLCVFLAAGNIAYKGRGLDFSDLGGLFEKMPFTMAGLLAGALSIIGVPPTCGFFSKWYLISGAIQAGHYGFLVALLFSSLVHTVLFFRVIERCYFEPVGQSHGGHSSGKAMEEAPLSMVIPLLLVAVGLIVLGIYSRELVVNIIQYAVPASMV